MKNNTKFKPLEQHPNWRGGRFICSHGYVLLKVASNLTVKEHIFVMEKHISRPLKKDEVMHHINGDRKDNRIENLQLLTRSEHSRLHATGKKATEKTRSLLREIRKGTNQKEEHQQWKSEVTEEKIIAAIRESSTKKEAAKKLGICPDTLRARIKHYKIEVV